MKTCKMKGGKIGRWEDFFHPSNLPTASQTPPRFAFLSFPCDHLFNLTDVLAVLRPSPPTLATLVFRLQ